MEKIHNEKRFGNPELHLARKRAVECFDNYFGKGEYDKRYPLKDNLPPAVAAPWNFERFLSVI
jgi:hypothetical protein